MSVVIETTLGDITVDLFINDRPRTCLNFLKLCKIKYYNYNLFHTISRSFIAQTGDPSGSRSEGSSIYGVLDGPQKRFFEGENEPRIKHTKMGLISFVGNEDCMIGSQFFLTLGEDLTYLDEKHCVFGEVVEGFDILEVLNEVICDNDDRPYQDVRITHTVILDDPFPDPKRLAVPSRSPSPSVDRLKGGRIAPDEEIDELEGKTVEEVTEIQAEKEAKARATILEMVGDIPDADMAPPENVLFVCKLNPVTNDDDLEIIFSRFGKIKSCEVIRDKKTGDSLQYAFVEFEDKAACENAYFKMDNVLIDDRRIHVDFSQSVSKVKWRGKGRGVTHYDEKGKRSEKIDKNIGKGNYKYKSNNNDFYKSDKDKPKRDRHQSESSASKTDRQRSEKSNKNSIRSKKSPAVNRHDSSNKERYSLKSNRDKSPIFSRKNDYRYNRDHSSYKKRSPSPRRNRDLDKERFRDKNESSSKKTNRSRSRTPNKYDSRRTDNKYIRKSSPEARNSKRKDTKESASESYTASKRRSEKYNKNGTQIKTKNTHTRKRSISRNNYSSASEGDSEPEKKKSKKNKAEYSSSDSELDSDSDSKNKLKKSKKRKDKYSSSEDSDDHSDKKKKRNKGKTKNKKSKHPASENSDSDSNDSTDSDYPKKQKSKKKKSAKKSKQYSNNTVSRKKKSKKKYDSDTN